MAAPGEIKARSVEVMLVFLRFLFFACFILIVSGVLWLVTICAGLPAGIGAAITGIVTGIYGFILLVSGMGEVGSFSCPSCGFETRVAKYVGSYRCRNCNRPYYIYGEEVRRLEN